jgi:LysM repeat protein
MHEAGLYQAVEGIPLGVQLRFSVWLQTWMCANASACQGGKASDAPGRMHLQVGIDPWGGIDPWSSDVIWSPEGEAFDQWRRFQVEAMSEAGVATVFIRSRAEWDWARLNNDVYIDDTRLEIVASPTRTGTPATLPGIHHLATATPSVLVTHTVAAGETLGSIALAHGVSIEQLVRLNRLSPGQAIYPRQVLVIWGTEPEALPIGRSSVLTTPTGTMVTVNASPCQNPTPFLTWTLGGFALVFVAWTVIMAVRRMQDRGT